MPDGRTTRCRADTRPLAQAAAWVDRHRSFWEGELDSLANYLEEDKEIIQE